MTIQDKALDVLKEIKANYGTNIFSQKNKMLSLFSDLAPELQKEKKILSYAYNENLPSRFLEYDAASDEEKVRFVRSTFINLINDETIAISRNAAMVVLKWFIELLDWNIDSSFFDEFQVEIQTGIEASSAKTHFLIKRIRKKGEWALPQNFFYNFTLVSVMFLYVAIIILSFSTSQLLASGSKVTVIIDFIKGLNLEPSAESFLLLGALPISATLAIALAAYYSRKLFLLYKTQAAFQFADEITNSKVRDNAYLAISKSSLPKISLPTTKSARRSTKKTKWRLWYVVSFFVNFSMLITIPIGLSLASATSPVVYIAIAAVTVPGIASVFKVESERIPIFEMRNENLRNARRFELVEKLSKKKKLKKKLKNLLHNEIVE